MAVYFVNNPDPEFSKLSSEQRDFLLRHYERCAADWRHWTPGIWSVPSLEAAINVGAYSLIYNNAIQLPNQIRVLALVVLVLLNFAVFVGLWKHRATQAAAGDRMREIEEFSGITPVLLKGRRGKIRASLFYQIVTLAVLIISIVQLLKLV
jgi:hypothetical protein